MTAHAFSLASKLDDVHQRMQTLKAKAGFFVTQRRRDIDLYALLAETLAVCEIVQREKLEESLRRAVAARQSDDKNRSYIEQGSDVFVVVGRFVFEPEINRAASWRYSATLREASKRGLRSTNLVEWLRANGGMNALFRARPVRARTARTKTLHLNTQVEVPKTGPFTLTLRRDQRGFFDVLAGADADSSAEPESQYRRQES